MNRVELKNKAKDLIKGNKWYILKPAVYVYVAIFILTAIAMTLDSSLGLVEKETIELADDFVTYNFNGPITDIVSLICGFVGCIFSVAYAYYILSFIRGKKMEVKEVFEFAKKNWVIAFLVTLVTGLIVFGCTILLIIPGIIAAMGLNYYRHVCADNPELKTMEIVKKTWHMTDGHKLDLFVLCLSFIGWAILACFTFGLLYIWLLPYFYVTIALYYEEIKQ